MDRSLHTIRRHRVLLACDSQITQAQNHQKESLINHLFGLEPEMVGRGPLRPPEGGAPRHLCGLFMLDGLFYVMPQVGLEPLAELFRALIITPLTQKRFNIALVL